MADQTIQIQNGSDNAYPVVKTENPPFLMKNMSRSVSHPSGSNYWSMDSFPAKAGYSRKVVALTTNNGSVVCTGWYMNDNTVIVRTYNLSNSNQTVIITVEAVYVRDDLVS